MKRFKIMAATTVILTLSPITIFAATPPVTAAVLDATGVPLALSVIPTRSPTPTLPNPAISAVPETASDLSYDEAKRLLPSFEVGKEGNDPESKARLFGVAPQACFSLGILVSNTDSVPGLSGSAGKFGFRINVTSAAKACLEGQVGQPLACGVAGNCVRLSEVPASTLSLSAKPDGEIVVLHENPSGDRVRMIADSINPVLKFESSATIHARQAEVIRMARDAAIKTYRAQVQNCRKDDDQLVVARTALQGLLTMGELHGSELESITKALDKAALEHLLKQALNGKLEDSFELREKLQAWATSNPDDVEKIAKAYFDLAQRYAQEQDTENPGAGIDMAQEIIAEAQTLDVSKTSRKRLASYRTELKLMKNEQLASGGWQNNMALQASLQSLIKGKGGLEDQAKTACKKFPQALSQMGLQSQQSFTFTMNSSSSSPSQEEALACSNASSTLSRAYGVRNTGMQADQASMQAQRQNGQNGQYGSAQQGGFGQATNGQQGFGGQANTAGGGFGQNSNLPQQNSFGGNPYGGTGFGQGSNTYGWGGNAAGNVGFGGGNNYGTMNSGQNGFGNGFNGASGFGTGRNP